MDNQETVRAVRDENPNIKSDEPLPVHSSINVLRYRTLKKNSAFGWWSAVLLLEDHGKPQICYYRWNKKKGKDWKRDKKLPIRSRNDWNDLKAAVETYLNEI